MGGGGWGVGGLLRLMGEEGGGGILSVKRDDRLGLAAISGRSVLVGAMLARWRHRSRRCIHLDFRRLRGTLGLLSASCSHLPFSPAHCCKS